MRLRHDGSRRAQKWGRQWIGIDVTYLAINLIKRRLRDAFGEELQFEEKGQPADLPSAQRLEELDKFQFQHWALSLVDARPLKEGDCPGEDGSGKLLAVADAPDGFSSRAPWVPPGKVSAAGTHKGRSQARRRSETVPPSLLKPSTAPPETAQHSH